jgi:hypothetical protein
LAILGKYENAEGFSLDEFKATSLAQSFQASQREISTQHTHEYLSDGAKGYFLITNYLGGEYHLTADEIVFESDTQVIIQESKNASRSKLPSTDDIRDGLFKLILFANMDELYLGDQLVKFTPQLKLTGNLIGQLTLPNDTETIEQFARTNTLSKKQHDLLLKLNQEALLNHPLKITVSGNL